MAWRYWPLAALALGLSAPARPQPQPIDASRIKEHVRTLASDAFAGRGTGQPGEAKTLAYLIAAFRDAGLAPAGKDGGWLQPVALADYRRTSAAIEIGAPAGRMTLVPGRDVTISSRLAGWTRIDRAPIVFLGHGVEAADLGWNDFAGVDMRGKVALFLANDPDFAQAAGPFGGAGLSYFGRVSAKIEAARRHGAIAAFIIHEMPASRIKWETYSAADRDPVTDLAGGPHFGLRGWIERSAASALFRAAGLDLDLLTARARAPGFRPILLEGLTFNAQVETWLRHFTTHNVLARWPGGHRAKDAVLLGAHWDAFGVGRPDASGEAVHHGAVDDAVGIATLLEVARKVATGPHFRRSLVFAAWAAEEKDLLGSAYFVRHPAIPLSRIAGVINLDPHRFPDAAHDVEILGPGRTDMESRLAQIAAETGLKITSETAPEAGWYFRSDQFSFAHAGVPALYFRMGPDLVEGGIPAGRAAATRYMSERYHKPADRYEPSWTMAGAAQEGELAYRLGISLADQDQPARWLPGPSAWEHFDRKVE